MYLNVLFLSCMAFCIGDSIRTDSIIVKQDSILKTIKLNDVIVKGNLVTHFPDKDVWTITKEMRKNTFDTYSLLNKIPGFYYDSFREKLTYWGHENVLVTIDGKVKDDKYGGNLANLRFKKIEVYDHPDGRLSGYYAVVNLITYENWQGYDFRGLNIATVLPSSDYGNMLSRRGHDYTYTYTRPKFDISSNLTYNHKDTRFLQAFDIIGNDLRYYSDGSSDYTNIQKSDNYSMYIDFDYKINKNHSLSAKYSFCNDDGDIDSHHERVISENLSTGIKNEMERRSSNHSEIKNHAISIFYSGTIRKWKFNVEVTRDIYFEKRKYTYSESKNLESESLLDNKRNSWLASLDAELNIGKKGSFNGGFLYYNRHYSSHEESQESDFSSHFIRNRSYVNLSHSLGKKLSVRVGAAAELLRTTNRSNKECQILWGANAILRVGGARDKFSGSLVYRSSTSHPTLYQITTIRNLTDPLLGYMGNTHLKAATSHGITLTTRWDRLSIYTAFSFSPNQIMPIYVQIGSSAYKTYDNVRTLGHSSVISYNPKVIKFLDNDLLFRASFTYAGFYLKQSYQINNVDYWGGQALLSYDIKNIINMQLGYTRMTSKSLASETLSQRAYDFWEVQLSKDFLKRRIQCQLSYTLPVKWGVEDMNYVDVVSPFYQQYTSYDSYCYTKNQIMIRVVFRLANGHVVRKKFHEQTQEKEIYNESIN